MFCFRTAHQATEPGSGESDLDLMIDNTREPSAKEQSSRQVQQMSKPGPLQDDASNLDDFKVSALMPFSHDCWHDGSSMRSEVSTYRGPLQKT